VNEQLLLQLMDMGYTIVEARLGLRSAKGDLEGAVEHINARREERERIRTKEKEERRLEKKRRKLGKCADGSWVNVGYHDTLLRMGFSKQVAATALRQANNSLNMAVQLLQEEPELIHLAAKNTNDADIATLVSLGYTPEMSAIALENEGSVERAAEALLNNHGIVTAKEDEDEDAAADEKSDQDKKAYDRIKDGISKGEEDHLDMDLKIEKEFLGKYLQLLSKCGKL